MNLLHQVTRTVQQLQLLLSAANTKRQVKQVKTEVKLQDSDDVQTSEKNATHYDTMLSSIADYIEGVESSEHIDESTVSGVDSNANDKTHVLGKLQDALTQKSNMQQTKYTLHDVMRHKGQVRAGEILVQLLRNTQ